MQKKTSAVDDRHAALERMLIDEFLESRGHTRQSVGELPPPQATTLMSAASRYASLRLAEIESRAHYVEDIHDPS